MTPKLATLHTSFYAMEEAEGLFDLRSDDGIFYWDIVRYAVFVGLQREYGGPFKAPVPANKKTLRASAKNVVKAALNRFTRAYLASQAPEYLFYTVQRTLIESRMVDTITDPIVELMGAKSIAIEAFNAKSISMLDMLLRRRTRVPPVFSYDPPESGTLQGIAAAISASVAKHFDRAPDVAGLIREPLATYKQYKQHFLALFATHRPKAVIGVNNGSLKGLFAAARERGIPTLELQHGAPSVESPFWTYPSAIPSTHPGLTLPTACLTFSEYFNEATHFPVAHTYAIGNDYLHQKPVANTSDAVAIVSAYMYNDDLVRLAVALAESFPDRPIYFRLHPHQFGQKAAIAEQMKHRPNIVVQSDEMSLAELFAACTFVIGVHSTVLYSALQARKKVMIFKISNYFFLQDLFPFAELFDSAADAAELIRTHEVRFTNAERAPVFFAPLDPAAVRRALASVGGLESSDASGEPKV